MFDLSSESTMGAKKEIQFKKLGVCLEPHPPELLIPAGK